MNFSCKLVFALSFLLLVENAMASSKEEVEIKKSSQHLTQTAQEQNALDITRATDKFLDDLTAKGKTAQPIVLSLNNKTVMLTSVVHMGDATYEAAKDEIDVLTNYEHLPPMAAMLNRIKQIHGNIHLVIGDIESVLGPALWHIDSKSIVIDKRQKHSMFTDSLLFEMSNAANPFAADPGFFAPLGIICTDKQTYGYLTEAAEYHSLALCQAVEEELYPKIFPQRQEAEVKHAALAVPRYNKPLEYFDSLDYTEIAGYHVSFSENIFWQREIGHTQSYEDGWEAYKIECSIDKSQKNFETLLKSNLIKAYLWDPLHDQLMVFAISQREFWRHRVEAKLLDNVLLSKKRPLAKRWAWFAKRLKHKSLISTHLTQKKHTKKVAQHTGNAYVKDMTAPKK